MNSLDTCNNFIESALVNYPLVASALGVVLLLLVAAILDLFVKRQLLGALRRLTTKTHSTWDDALLEHRVFNRVAQCVPPIVIILGAKWIPGIHSGLLKLVDNVALAYLALMIAMAFSAFLGAANSIYEQYPIAKNRPIKGYIQVATILIYCIGAILIVSALLNRSPLLLLGGFGAMTAVLLLIFQDTILSFVASIQLVSNDMVRVGDWIEMPDSNADGDVIDVALHTVKVQNWDKTITTIPTHKLITQSFRNWRGMSESGGRRIKRALLIDQNSVRFLSDAETATFKRFELLREYITTKQNELSTDNDGLTHDDESSVNLRRLTNLGTFRAYVVSYLRSRSDISNHMTFLVRQLPPNGEGLPLEIYVFTDTTDWTAYESIQADIFDHLLAIIPSFGLRVFQQPSGPDIRALSDGVDRP